MKGAICGRPNKLNLSWLALGGLGIVAVLLLPFFHQKLNEYAFDDAYIHFRIASNLATYGSPYFNLNEPIKASSSSGWTLLLCLMIWFSRLLGQGEKLPQFVAGFNSLVTLCGAVLYTSLLARLSLKSHHPFLYGVFFIGYIALTLVSSIGLMETATALVIVGIAFHLFLNNSRYCFIFFALALFFRLEFIVVLALILAYAIISKRFPYKDMLIFSLLGGLPLIIYDLYFFGTVVPNTIKAKSTVYSLAYLQVIASFWESLLPDVSFSFVNYYLFKLFTAAYISGVISLVSAVFIYRLLKSVVKRRFQAEEEAISFLIWGWCILIAGAYIAAKTMIFPWYVPLYSVPLWLILGKMILDSETLIIRTCLVILIIPLLASQLFNLAQVALGASFNPAYYPDFMAGARVRQYIQVGKGLFDQYPQAKLLTSEIGGLGYGFKGYIIDGAGLITPLALAYHPMKVPEERSSGLIGAIPPDVVEKFQPDIIVSYDTFIEAFLRSEISHGYIRTKCQVFLEDDLRRSGGRTIWNNKYLNVFIRRDFLSRTSSAESSFCQLSITPS